MLNIVNIDEIKKFDKITVVKENDFGYPIVLNLRLTDVYFKDWAQYKNCLFVVGKLPRKRKNMGYLIKQNTPFAIFAGTIDKEKFNNQHKTTGSIMVDYGVAFDESAFSKFVDIDVEPICKKL